MCASLPFQPSAYPLPELMLYPIQFVSLFPFLWFLISLNSGRKKQYNSKPGDRSSNKPLAIAQFVPFSMPCLRQGVQFLGSVFHRK